MLNDIHVAGRWKTHLCLIINCSNLQGLMSIILLHAIAEAQWQTESPQLDADEKSSICTLTVFGLTLQLSNCKGWAVYVCMHVHTDIFALVLVSLICNPHENWEDFWLPLVMLSLPLYSEQVHCLYWYRIFPMRLSCLNILLLFEIKDTLSFHFSFTSASFGC